MELRQIEQFVAVAEEQHFARAASRCAVLPSSLSTSIKALETELGVVLFRRTTRSVALSQAGRAFLVHARNCLAAAAAGRSAVDNVRDLLTGSIAIGGIPTPGLIDQPRLLQNLRADHPGLSVFYTRDTSSALIDGVRASRLDLAFVSLPNPPPADLTVVDVAEGPVMLACRADHEFAWRESVRPEELAGMPFVATQPGSRGYEYIDRIFAMADRPRNVPYEVNDVASMLDFVEAGLGVALVARTLAADRGALRVLAIDDPSFTWTVAAVAPPGDQVSPAARALLTLVADLPSTVGEPATSNA